MKKLTTLLLTIFTLACNAQEPRLMYSVEYVDSLNNKIEFLENLITAPINKIIADTIFIELKGETNNVDVILDIKGSDTWLTIVDKDRNDLRLQSWYVNGKREIRLAQDTIQKGSWFPDK